MLRVYWGHLDPKSNPNFIQHPNNYWGLPTIRHWFDIEEVKQIVKKIDNTDVTNGLQMYNPTFGGCNYTVISSGCKNIVLAYMLDNPVLNGDCMGDNAFKVLVSDITPHKDVTIQLNHYILDRSIPYFDSLLLNNNTYAKTRGGLTDICEDYEGYLDDIQDNIIPDTMSFSDWLIFDYKRDYEEWLCRTPASAHVDFDTWLQDFLMKSYITDKRYDVIPEAVTFDEWKSMHTLGS